VEQDERCSPSVAQEWQKYIDMVNLSDEKLNELVWGRIGGVLSVRDLMNE
jgi:hypothetical protein